MLCRQQVADLAVQEPEFAARNADLIVIGNGVSQHLQPFREATGYRGQLYTDPTLAVYKILDLKSGLSGLLGMKTFQQGFKAFRKGVSQDGIQGSALQLGGALVLGPGDTIHYVYRSREAGDHPPVDQMLAACEIS
jgi:hypothetical protein